MFDNVTAELLELRASARGRRSGLHAWWELTACCSCCCCFGGGGGGVRR